MARVTIEDCLRRVDNRFSLVHLASQRVHQLREGAVPHIKSKNKEIVLSLREVAAGKIFPVSEGTANREKSEAEARKKEILMQAKAKAEEDASKASPKS